MPNAAPVVVNDVAAVVPSGSLLVDVLANDSDANGDILTISSIGSPALGTATIESGKIRYNASSTFGPVSIPYTVIDELGVSSTGTLTVRVNSAPTDISLSASTINENVSGGTLGDLTVSDPTRVTLTL